MTTVSLQQRKQKRSEADKKYSATGDLVIKVIEMQHENDQRLIELEEKRMKFEDNGVAYKKCGWGDKLSVSKMWGGRYVHVYTMY